LCREWRTNQEGPEREFAEVGRSNWDVRGKKKNRGKPTEEESQNQESATKKTCASIKWGSEARVDISGAPHHKPTWAAKPNLKTKLGKKNWKKVTFNERGVVKRAGRGSLLGGRLTVHREERNVMMTGTIQRTRVA